MEEFCIFCVYFAACHGTDHCRSRSRAAQPPLQALGAGDQGHLRWGEAHETPRDSSAIPPREGQKDAAPTSSMDSRPSSLRGVGDSQRGAPRICLLRSLGQSHQNLLPAKAKGSVLIYTHLLPGAANLMHFYTLDGSSWMRTAVVVVTCRGFAV